MTIVYHERMSDSDPRRPAAAGRAERSRFRLWLLQRRTGRLWSQRELADRAGLSQSEIVLLEAGRRSPSLETLARLCHALSEPFTVGGDW